MTTYTTTRAERETVIQFDEADNIVSYYTASPKRIRELDRMVNDYPDEFTCVWDDEFYGAKKYRFPAKYIGVKKPASEARRKAARANAGRRRAHIQKHNQLAQNTDLSHSPEEIAD